MAIRMNPLNMRYCTLFSVPKQVRKFYQDPRGALGGDWTVQDRVPDMGCTVTTDPTFRFIRCTAMSTIARKEVHP